jgi:NAD(P)-dependent dehydrogenase (short-subunit alcohol dehydrogenase family)
MSEELSGKIALVTGASRGIGRTASMAMRSVHAGTLSYRYCG